MATTNIDSDLRAHQKDGDTGVHPNCIFAVGKICWLCRYKNAWWCEKDGQVITGENPKEKKKGGFKKKKKR